MATLSDVSGLREAELDVANPAEKHAEWPMRLNAPHSSLLQTQDISDTTEAVSGAADEPEWEGKEKQISQGHNDFIQKMRRGSGCHGSFEFPSAKRDLKTAVSRSSLAALMNSSKGLFQELSFISSTVSTTNQMSS